MIEKDKFYPTPQPLKWIRKIFSDLYYPPQSNLKLPPLISGFDLYQWPNFEVKIRNLYYKYQFAIIYLNVLIYLMLHLRSVILLESTMLMIGASLSKYFMVKRLAN